MASVPRPVKFTLLLSQEERAMLDWLAGADGVDASSHLRLHIRTEYARRVQGCKSCGLPIKRPA